MSVFDEIDRKLAEFKALKLRTRVRVRELGGAWVRADEVGNWFCAYRPTRGDRIRVKLKARSPDELVALLAQQSDRPGRKPNLKAVKAA